MMTIEQFIVLMKQIETELEFDAHDDSIRSVQSGEPVIFLGFMKPCGRIPPRIGNIYLDEIIRRRGIGRTIVANWEDLLRTSDQTTSGVTNVQKEGEGFWKKMGYRPAEEGRNFMWIKSLT